MRGAYDRFLVDPENREIDMPNIHNQFCRCNRCKPPLVGEQTMDVRRLEAALIMVLVLALVIWMAAR